MTPELTIDQAELAAIMELDGGLPRDLAECYAKDAPSCQNLSDTIDESKLLVGRRSGLTEYRSGAK